MLEPAQIERMSTAERLQAMEQLWEALCKSDEEVSSPAWHGDVLADRIRRAQQGEARFLTLEQLRDRLQQSRE
jgi:Putative addiction module component